MGVIDQIKETIPIVDVLERYAGANFTKDRTSKKKFNIHCPYHNDSSPSFTVYTATNTFRCWSGCNDGKPGDAVDIVKLSQNISTKDAIKVLVKDYGLGNPQSDQAKEWQQKRANRERLAAEKKELDREVNVKIDELRQLEKTMKQTLSEIKTVEDLETVGDLYHVVAQVDYWLDCLVEPNLQRNTLKELTCFFESVN